MLDSMFSENSIKFNFLSVCFYFIINTYKNMQHSDLNNTLDRDFRSNGTLFETFFEIIILKNMI